MDEVSSAAALALAAVFVWAGVAKLLRPRATAATFAALDVPAAPFIARVVPAIEVMLGVGLVFTPAFAGWVALALLAVFTLVLVRAMQSGVEAPCSCFGSARAEPVSSSEVVRNALLAALAVVATGASTAPQWPALPALVTVTLAVALGRLLLGVLDLRRAADGLWPRLPGEAR